jgi:hypothetical protein
MDYTRLMEHDGAGERLLTAAVQVRQNRPHLVDLLLLPRHDGFAEFANSLILFRKTVCSETNKKRA